MLAVSELMMVHAKRRYIAHLLKELEQLKRSVNIERTAVNKVTSKYTMQYPMLQSLRQSKNNKSEPYTRNISYSCFNHFSTFFAVLLKLKSKSSNFLRLHLILTSHLKRNNKFCVHGFKTITTKDYVQELNFANSNQFLLIS